MSWLRSLVTLLFGAVMAIPGILLRRWYAVTTLIAQSAVGLCYETPPWGFLLVVAALVVEYYVWFR